MATNRLQSSTPQCVWSTWEWWWWWSLLLQQCHVIHQALMMVIRNQFGTTVESCQSIMFNLIHMQKEKKEVHIVWKITPNWLEFLSSKMSCLVPLIDRNLQVFKNSPKWNILVIFYLLYSKCKRSWLRWQCRMRLLGDFQTPWGWKNSLFQKAQSGGQWEQEIKAWLLIPPEI